MSIRKKSRIIIGAGAALAFVALMSAAIVGSTRAFGSSKKETIPTIRVQRGTVEMKVHTTGELRPAKSSLLVAPQMGGQLQIVTLRTTGERVKQGDVVAEFDPSDQEFNLEQARIDVAQAEQEIIKAKADTAVQTAQDKVALLRARFDVRRAELEVSRNELVSSIDARKNNLALDEAKRKLAQLEQDVKSRVASSAANVVVLEEKRNKARLSMMVAQTNIDNMLLKAPADGIVSIKENRNVPWFPGIVIPELRAGDTLWPGAPVADILQVDQMEILSKVSENDRSNINPGQPVEVRLDADPGQRLSGKVKTIAGMASRGPWWMASTERKFDATFTLDATTTTVRPGSTAQVVILGEKLNDALFLPRQAIFDKDGKPVVYLRNGNGFEPREVKITTRTESQVAIEGVKEGEEVALVNPELQRGKRNGGKAPSPVGGPGAPAKAGA